MMAIKRTTANSQTMRRTVATRMRCTSCLTISSRSDQRPQAATSTLQKMSQVALPSSSAMVTSRQGGQLIQTPSLSLSRKLVQSLFPSRSPHTQLAPAWLFQSELHGSQLYKKHYTAFQVQLAFEVDGQLLTFSTLVELRFYPGRNAVRLHCNGAYDIFHERILMGWRKDVASRLVAVLRSTPAASPITTCVELMETRRHHRWRGLVAAAVPRSPPPSAIPSLHATPLEPVSFITECDRPHQAHVSRPFQGSAPSLTCPASYVPTTAKASNAGATTAGMTCAHKPLSPTPTSLRAQTLTEKAGLDATATRPAVAAAPTAVLAPLPGPPQHTPPAAHQQATHVKGAKRTYVPARLRPILNEVYVPFGFWRVLFDGEDRPFPINGINIRVAITGVVQMAAQPVLLVRRATPYGYYVLLGLKGLTRLKGKLMMRWRLLMDGVVELETALPVLKLGTSAAATGDGPSTTVRPGSIRPRVSSRPSFGTGNIVPIPGIHYTPPAALATQRAASGDLPL